MAERGGWLYHQQPSHSSTVASSKFRELGGEKRCIDMKVLILVITISAQFPPPPPPPSLPPKKSGCQPSVFWKGTNIRSADEEAASIIESQLGNPPKGALAPPAASSSQSQLGLNIDQKSSIIFSFEETQTSYLSKLLDSLGYLRCYMHLCSVHWGSIIKWTIYIAFCEIWWRDCLETLENISLWHRK